MTNWHTSGFGDMVFNHDGFGLLAELAATDCTPVDADRMLVAPLAWMADGLLDAVIPATHNHEPDPFDWFPEAFVAAAKRSPRPCAVWPQLWPTPEPWNAGHNRRHASDAVQRRCDSLNAAGADGIYFFNFCCYGPLEGRCA